MTIRLHKVEKYTKFLDPRLEFNPSKQNLEYRRDPLTGSWCRINVLRAQRIKQAEIGVRDELTTLMIKKSRDGCYFCKDMIDKSTPRFPDELVETGRIRRGQAVVFPNLHPFGEHHAICVMSEAHYLDLYEFTPQILKDSFRASIEFFEKVRIKDRKARYPSINFNYMPPAGASLIHPHFQILMDSRPTVGVKRLMRESLRHYKKHGKCYWMELLKEERRMGERFIGDVGSFSWISSWSPRGNDEVLGISKIPNSCILDLKLKDLRDLSNGLSQLFKGMSSGRGVESLNLTVYSGPTDEDMSDHFRVLVKMISRTTPKTFYTSDEGFMEILHEEPIIQTMPEGVAQVLRDYLRS